jgi:hypothetical protein
MTEVQEALKQKHPTAALHYVAKSFLEKDEVMKGFSILQLMP